MLAIPIFLKEISAGKTRLFLTILAIAWATTTITFILAVGEGLRLSFSKTSDSIGKNFMVIMGGQTSSTFQGQSPNQNVKLTQADFNAIAQGVPDIIVLPEYRFDSSINYLAKTTARTINAVYPNYAALRNLAVEPGGRFIDAIDIRENRRVIVIGKNFAEEVLPQVPSHQLLGKVLTIDQKPFTIIGVLTPKPAMWFYQMPDNYLAWIPASTYLIEKRPEEISNFLVFAGKNQRYDDLKRQITQLVAYHHQLDPQDQNILQITDIKKRQEETQSVLKGTEIFLGIIGTLTLVVAGVGIANVMFISVHRSTREIGTRMALGARSWQILRRYIAEALLATFVGGSIGIIIACFLVWGINQVPLNNEMFNYIGKPKATLSLAVISIVLIILGSIGLLAGFFPAKRAATIDPAKALRHE